MACSKSEKLFNCEVLPLKIAEKNLYVTGL